MNQNNNLLMYNIRPGVRHDVRKVVFSVGIVIITLEHKMFSMNEECTAVVSIFSCCHLVLFLIAASIAAVFGHLSPLATTTLLLILPAAVACCSSLPPLVDARCHRVVVLDTAAYSCTFPQLVVVFSRRLLLLSIIACYSTLTLLVFAHFRCLLST